METQEEIQQQEPPPKGATLVKKTNEPPPGAVLVKKKSSHIQDQPDFTHGYKPTAEDLKTKQGFADLENGFTKLPNGSKPSPGFRPVADFKPLEKTDLFDKQVLGGTPIQKYDYKMPAKLLPKKQEDKIFGGHTHVLKATNEVGDATSKWSNIGQFLPHTVMAGLDKDAGDALEFLGNKLPQAPTPLLTKDMGQSIAEMGKKLEGFGQSHEQTAQAYKLPNTAGGEVASSAIGFIPDLLELAVTPELDVAKVGKLGEALTKYGGKYAVRGANLAVGKFPIQQGIKGLVNDYSDAKSKGMDDYDATAHALKNGVKEYGKGILFEGAGKAAEKASDIGKRLMQDNGWMSGNKIVSGAQKAILHSTAQATAFSTVPFITNALQGSPTSLDEMKSNAIFGGLMGLFHGKEKEEEPTAADGAAKQVLERSPLVDMNNFMSADMDAVKYAHDLDATPIDLHLKAAGSAQKSYYSDDPKEKQEHAVQSSLNARLASVKAVTQAILKDKDAVIEGVNDLPIEDADKQKIIDKINQVHKELDPVEQQKTDLGDRISEKDAEIKQLSEKSQDPVKQAENELQLEDAKKEREELNNQLKSVILKQKQHESKNEGQGGQPTEAEKESQTTDEAIGRDERSVPQVGKDDEKLLNAPGGDEPPSVKDEEIPSAQRALFNSAKTKLPDLDLDKVVEQSKKNAVSEGREAPNVEDFAYAIKQVGRPEDLNEEDKEYLKKQENAVQKQSTGTLDVQPTSGDGKKVGEGNTEPKSTPQQGEEEKTPEEKGGKEVKKTILTKRAYEGEIQDEVKKHLEEKGLMRKSFSQEERSNQSTDFINKFGEDAAFQAVKSGDIGGAMAASTLAQLQIRNSRAMDGLPDGEEKDGLAKKQADYIELAEKKGYLGGEFNGQLAYEYQNAELNYASIKRQVEKLTNKPLTPGQEKKVKEVVSENEQLKAKLQEAEAKLIEETDKAFKAGADAVKNETKAQRAKRIADKLRAAKIHRPGVFSSATPASLAWDTAVEITAKTIETGGKIADAIEAGMEHIKNTDWYKGLPTNKKELAEKEFKRFHNDNSGSTDLHDLQERFVDKKDNKFTPDEAKDIWRYMKENYLENKIPFPDAIAKTASDLGLSWRQISEAITTPKTKRISDEMWKKQSEYARNRSAIKNWIGDQNKSVAGKALQNLSGMFRGVAVFGHGGIFVGTHAGMNLFNPSTWNKVVPAFIRGWKFAYGNEGEYQRSIEELKNSPNYLLAQRAGLKNNPERINSEEYQKSQKYLGKLGLAGERGFNAIKVLRQDLFDYHFNKLSPDERDDPAVSTSIARIVNLATGATGLNIPAWVNEASFAGGMEAARWGKLTANPGKAAKVAINAIINPSKSTTAERVFARVWARRVGEQLATFTGALLANSAIQNTMNPSNPVNMTNPNKPDFLKFKFGDVTIDPTSGMRSAATFLYTLGKIPFENQKSLRGERRDKVLGKAVAGYARGKLAPLYSTLADVFESRDFSGNVMPYSNEKPGKHNRKLGYVEYGTSKLPLPIAEAFGVYYQSALDHGAHKKTLENATRAIMSGVISGSTGFRVGEYKDGKKKENSIFER